MQITALHLAIMKAHERNTTDSNQMMVLVNQSHLDRLETKLEQILDAIHNRDQQQATLDKYVSEQEAKKLLGKSTTWLWEQRTKGKLPSSKVGSTNYYRIEDIEALIEENFKK